MNKTLYEVWYGHIPSVSYLKIFSSKCYIHKDARNENFDLKGDEGIFLGYSTMRKTYKCLNKSTDTVIESDNVIIGEFANKNDEKRKKKHDDYNKFVYVYADELGILLDQ